MGLVISVTYLVADSPCMMHHSQICIHTVLDCSYTTAEMTSTYEMWDRDCLTQHVSLSAELMEGEAELALACRV